MRQLENQRTYHTYFELNAPANYVLLMSENHHVSSENHHVSSENHHVSIRRSMSRARRRVLQDYDRAFQFLQNQKCGAASQDFFN